MDELIRTINNDDVTTPKGWDYEDSDAAGLRESFLQVWTKRSARHSLLYSYKLEFNP